MRKLTISNKYVAQVDAVKSRPLSRGEARKKGIKKFGVKIPTVLLRGIFDDTGALVADHQWADNEFGITEADIGKTVEFSATIVPYVKNVNGNMSRDFKLKILELKLEDSVGTEATNEQTK